jgi:hypothetical protein
MNITDFLAIAVVGAILSVVVQIIKQAFGTESNTTKLITIALALIVGGLYVWIRSTPYFETAILVLTSASAVYALVMK